MSAIDDMTGLLGVTVAAGVVTKVAQSMFPTPQPQYQAPARRTKKGKKATRRTYRTSSNGFGNFNNVGF